MRLQRRGRMELRRRNVICRNRTEHKNKQQPVPFFCKADTPAGRDAENSAYYCLARCIRTYFQAFPDSLYLKPRTFYLRAGSRTFYLSPPCQTTEAFKSVCVWHPPDIAGQRRARCWALSPEPQSICLFLGGLLRSS